MKDRIQNVMQRMKEVLADLRAKETPTHEKPMQETQDARTETGFDTSFEKTGETLKQDEQKTPSDELPTFRRRRVWPYLVLNVLAAVVLGLSLYALALLQDGNLIHWSSDGSTTGGFSLAVFDEAKSAVDRTLTSQSWSEFDSLAGDTPIPHTFGSWSSIQQIDYMAAISAKPTAQEKLKAAQTYLQESKNEETGFAMASGIFYTKADLQHWMQVGLKKEATEVELRFGHHTDFRPKKNKTDDPYGEERMSGNEERSYSDDGWTPDIIQQAIEVAKPLSADSLLAASQGNLETYRESLTQLQNTLDFLKTKMRLPDMEKPSNVEYTISILNGAKKFTNANRVKDKTPAWSAPITVEGGYCTIGTGLWKEKLSNGAPPIPMLLAQAHLFNAPGMKVTFRIDTTLQEADGIQLYMETFPTAQKVSKIAVVAAVVSGILWLATLCVTLVRTTNVHLPMVRKIEGAIPIEVLLVACIAFLWITVGVAIEVLYTVEGQAMALLRDPWHNPFWIVLIPGLIVFDLVGWTLLSMLFRKARQGRFFRGSILGGVGRAVHRVYRSYQDGSAAKHRILVKVLLFYLLLGLLLVLVAVFYSDFFWMLLLLTGFTLPIAFALQQDRNDARILQSMQHIADGDWHERLDEESFHGAHRAMANQINRFDQSLQNAVEKSLKNERMQTELITNVSHDLRTPLTSIINYVDLLRSPDATDDERTQYLDVLAKKAQRLKTLMNDLIDVSKATSGAVQLNMEIIDYAEVIRQSLAEADSGWKKNALTPVVDLPEDPLFIEADGHKLSRVLENLFSNAQKYSQDGTRVYIQLEAQDHHALFTIKNTSRYALNMSPEELLERFNRSDKSRTTEGSGLGLSIAEQLTKRMNGHLALDIDGDLFKASVEFPLH
ncbi:histidine kinase dimerization/phospho-acceptor domain-containing protein [Murdochiella vaginalis]|uniref:sensor histidine kinase n=1 Tax=Murdochiella vaginalis TaxID=1852373 RepID=UPI0008FDDE88|nr:histidine kinase dimerization/phospho-acceptor domain-containing protein [Murdochiella vaginalis]